MQTVEKIKVSSQQINIVSALLNNLKMEPVYIMAQHQTDPLGWVDKIDGGECLEHLSVKKMAAMLWLPEMVEIELTPEEKLYNLYMNHVKAWAGIVATDKASTDNKLAALCKVIGIQRAAAELGYQSATRFSEVNDYDQ